MKNEGRKNQRPEPNEEGKGAPQDILNLFEWG